MTGAAAPVATLWSSTRTSGTVAHLAVAVSGLPVEVRFLSLRGGEHKRPEYLAINPKGEVPALALADGPVVTEIPAIIGWLDDTAPEAGLLPRAQPDRALAQSWVAWCAYRQAQDMGAAFRPAFVLPGGDEAATAAVRAAALARMRAALAYADAALADGRDLLLATDRPTAADLYLALLARFGAGLGLDAGDTPNLGRLVARVMAVPAVLRALARETAAG